MVPLSPQSEEILVASDIGSGFLRVAAYLVDEPDNCLGPLYGPNACRPTPHRRHGVNPLASRTPLVRMGDTVLTKKITMLQS